MRKTLRTLLLLLALVVPVLAACGNPGPESVTEPGAVAPTGPTAAAEGNVAEPIVPTAMMEEPTAMMEEPTAMMVEPTSAPEATAATGGGTADGAPLKIGLVTDVGKINDGTFNQFAYEGLQRAEAELGVETAYIETVAQADYEKNIDQFATQDYDMIIGVGFLMGDAIDAASKKYPDINFAIVDFAYDPALPNVEGLVFAEDQAGYLAGALAASMTKTGIIAVVGGVEIPPVQKYVLGYENGAKSINPDVQVQKVYIDSFTDRARGGEAARNFISQGADVIFGAGGQTGSGGIQTAAQQDVYVIGVDQDEYGTTFQNGAAPGANKVLSSAIKRVDNAVFQAIKAEQDGTFEGGTVLGDASSEGVGLAPFHDADAEIPAEVKAKLAEILQGLSDGSVETGVQLQ